MIQQKPITCPLFQNCTVQSYSRNPPSLLGARCEISAFGNRNPIYWTSSFGAGAGFTYDLSKAVSLSLGYLATQANDTKSGLTGSPYEAIAQLTLRPSEAINLGLTYVRSYNGFNDINVGSTYAKDPFNGNNSTANSYGLETNFQISPKFALGG